MISRSLFRLTVLVSCFCFVTLCGCVRTKASKFYRLSSAVSNSGTGAQTIDTGRELAIGVGPVKLPQYLDRPQIVTNTSSNRYESSEFDRWAEPLRDNITSVLEENLSMLLATDRIKVFPWIDSTEIDYQVVVAVINFEGEQGGNVSLIARWTILGGSEKKELLTQKSSLSSSSGGAGYEALVTAQSRLLGDLSREIATGIRGLSQKSQRKDEELCSLSISVVSSKDHKPVAGADVIIRSYSQRISEGGDKWTSGQTIQLTTDEKGNAYTDAVELTGSACDARATARKGMIYRGDITVSAGGFHEARQKTFFDCKNPHPEASFHLSPQ